MRPLDARDLRPGDILRRPLFTRHGVKLLGAGITLTGAMCRALRGARDRTIYVAGSGSEVRAELGEAVTVRTARPGAGRSEPAAAGSDAAGPAGAGDAGMAEVPTAADEDGGLVPGSRGVEGERIRTRARMMLEAESVVVRRWQKWDRLARRVPAGVAPLELADTETPDVPRPEELVRVRLEGIADHRGVLARLAAGRRVDAGELLGTVETLMDLVTRWPRRYGGILAGESGDSVAEHGYDTCVLAVGIAARAGWAAWDVRAAGLAGLLSDAGMALVGDGVRAAARPLDDIELNRVRRHPSFTVRMLQGVGALPESVELAAYQHHERDDGTGYPRGLRAPALHDLPRLIAVADTYAALTARRAYRPRRQRYEAMREVITLAARGTLSRRFARALVQLLGLFPVGSCVKLSTGQAALVVGASPVAPDRPIVRAVASPAHGLRFRDAESEGVAAGAGEGEVVGAGAGAVPGRLDAPGQGRASEIDLSRFGRDELRVREAYDPPESARAGVAA